ncbi:MAG: phosphoribosylglycinamide formyltransferase 1 [Gaiellaceae bacterium]|jgi:hypothetical protein|nr:phosphoribosylglycinamide formyltransferase 1 [Gaiellaceae bacterium]
MSGVPVVIVTANHARHRWFAAQLVAAAELEIRGVVSEAKRASTQQSSPDQPPLVQRHFEARAATEQRHFGGAPDWDELGAPVLELPFGESNGAGAFAWVSDLEPTHLLLLGCSIIRAPLLERYALQTVNTHLGLSPYFRGAATNFWALEHGKPECVGATIHLATTSVDAGPTLRQVRPQLEAADDLHDVGCKALAAAAEVLPATLAAYAEGTLEPTPQPPGGLLFRSADFDEAALARALERLRAGLVRDYLAFKATRDAAYPIVG